MSFDESSDIEILFKDGHSIIYKSVCKVRHLDKEPEVDAGGLVMWIMKPDWWFEGLIELTYADGSKEIIKGETVFDVIYR